MKLKIQLYLTTISIIILSMNSCQKQADWLDIKTNKGSVTPETIADFQALLDNALLNSFSTAGLASADNFYMTDLNFGASNQESRNLYTWNSQIWEGDESSNWSDSFKAIEYANIALDGINKFKTQSREANTIKGQALFHRALAYYNLCQLFCKAYSPTAENDLGLPIRNSSDVNTIAKRSTLSQTYAQMLDDAISSSTMVSETQPYLTRPNRSACYALIAKIYLNMGDFINAEAYASKSLKLSPQLLDFNNATIVNLTTTYRFPLFGVNNPEILFYGESAQYSQIVAQTSSKGIVLPELYASYESNDLRKAAFFAVTGADAKFRGTYSGRLSNFCGLATNEVYLIHAECTARNGNAALAMMDLNTLLKNRFKSGTYVIKTAANADEALAIILSERRKELPYTGNIRWEDLRRLNSDPRFKKTLTRTVNGVTYTLAPNDMRYVLPIPNQELRLAGLEQNIR